MTILDFFSIHPVFRREEFAEFLAGRGASSPWTADSHLRRYLGAGRIGRVKRGVFFVAGPGETATDAPLDFLLVASRLAPDAVLAYHSALEAHGHAQSLFERFFFLSATQAKPLTLRGRSFVPVVPPAALRRRRKAFTLCTEVERRGLPCRVTTLERTLVDVLDRPDLAGGLEEAWRSLAGVPLFDLKVVLAYVRLCGQAALAAKVGLFLERRREPLGVSEAVLARLRRMCPKQPQYLDRRVGGRLAPGWNLIVPAPLLAGEWEAAA